MRSAGALAWLVLFAATAGALSCAPRNRPEGPGEKPSSTVATGSNVPRRSDPAGGQGAREFLVGEMCPQAAGGRAAVVPIAARRVSWIDGEEELADAVERRWTRQFSVFGWDGRRVGLFSVAGAAEVGGRPAVATGSYAGGSPCQPPAREAEDVQFDPACVKSQEHCALAVAELRPPGGFDSRPFDEDPRPAEFPIGGACAAGGKLLVDLDRDGTTEAFRVGDFLDSFRAPAEEVLAVEAGDASCEPSFAARHVVPPADPRDWRGLDVLGVLDLDGDGRYEIVTAYHYAGRRTWALYSPRQTAARLELVGEGVPWSRE